MPISVDTFEDASVVPGEVTNAERILWLLAAHDQHAFTRSEIADGTGVAPNSVGPVLARLKTDGVVRHRGRYWTLAANAGDDDRLPLSGEHSTDTPEGVDEGSNRHRAAFTAFAKRVTDHFANEITALYLFGSVARGAHAAHSDVDVLAVIADDAEFRRTDDRLLDLAFEVQLEYDVSIEVHTLPAADFTARKDRDEPFVRTVISEGEQYVG